MERERERERDLANTESKKRGKLRILQFGLWLTLYLVWHQE